MRMRLRMRQQLRNRHPSKHSLIKLIQPRRIIHPLWEMFGITNLPCSDHSKCTFVTPQVFGGEGIPPSADEVAACEDVASPQPASAGFTLWLYVFGG